MGREPVERLESASGLGKADDETVREYVERIATENDVDPDTLDRALTYITEWHYSEGAPADDAAFQSMISEVSHSGDEPVLTDDTGEGSSTPNSGGDRRNSPDGDRPGVANADGPSDRGDDHLPDPATESSPDDESTSDAESAATPGVESGRQSGVEAESDVESDPESGVEPDPEPGAESDAASSATSSEMPGSTTDVSPNDASLETADEPTKWRNAPSPDEGQGPAAAWTDSVANAGEQDRHASPSFGDAGSGVGLGHEADPDAFGFKSGLRGSEPRKLLVRFVAIVATAPVIGWMVARAWVPGNVVYDQGQAILGRLLGLSGPVAVDLVAVFAGGLYVSLLVLFTVDVKKRVQGMLLLLGSTLALGVVGVAGVFFPALDVTPLTLVSFLLGFAGGLVLEADQLFALDPDASTFKRPTLENGDVPEFRHTARLLFALLVVVVVATFVQVVLAGTVQVFDVVAAGVFLVLLYQFVQYESETSYMTLGPERSGKSMLLLGLCLELLRDGETYPNPNEYLQNSLERASNLQPGAERWPIPSTAHDELRAASFEVIAGSYFPRRLELTALDYAGQHLGRVAGLLADGDQGNEADASADGAGVTGKRDGSGTATITKSGTDSADAPSEAPDEAGREAVTRRIADRIRETETLFFVLDVERLVFPEAFQDAGATEHANVSWGLEQYETVLDSADPDDVLVVATKCDILVDQELVAPPSAHDSFAAFRAAVTESLSARPDVRELLETTDASTIHPVYFETRRRAETYVPRLDGDGNLVPVGFDHLITAIRQRQ